MILELRPPRFGRASTLLVLVILGYLIVASVPAIDDTVALHADAARACTAALQHGSGKGLTVQSARDLAEVAELPVDYEGPWPWPTVLAQGVTYWKDIPSAASWWGVFALLVVVAAWPLFLWRSLRIPGWAAMMATVPLACHPATFSAAVDPGGGAVALLITAAAVIVLTQCRGRALVPGAIAAAVVTAAIPGAVVPTTDGSHVAGLLDGGLAWLVTCALVLPCLAGIGIWPRIPTLLPLLAMGAGHFVSMVVWPGTQVGPPLLLVASGITATVLVHARGPELLLALIATAAATALAAPNPALLATSRAEATSPPGLTMALEEVNTASLSDSVLLTPAPDEVAWHLECRTVSSRGLQWDPERIAGRLVDGGVTHVLLLWNAADPDTQSDRMDQLARDLSPESQIEAQKFQLDDAGRKSGFRLLRLTP